MPQSGIIEKQAVLEWHECCDDIINGQLKLSEHEAFCLWYISKKYYMNESFDSYDEILEESKHTYLSPIFDDYFDVEISLESLMSKGLISIKEISPSKMVH